jgi:hypothetical protein
MPDSPAQNKTFASATSDMGSRILVYFFIIAFFFAQGAENSIGWPSRLHRACSKAMKSGEFTRG